MELAQRRQAHLANKGRKEVEYHTGQLVLLSTKNLRMKPGKAKKLLPRFIGPFKVLEHVGPVAVRLDLPRAMARMHPVFHVSLLRPYTSEHPHLPPPVEWLDEAPLYEVEKLLAHRGVRAVRPETTTYWSPDTNDTAFGARHNCLLVRHTGLSTWNVPADDAVALKCVNHAIHSATQEEAMATIMLIPGKRGISYPKHIDTLRRYPEYWQHLASIPPTKTTGSKPGRHANLHIYVIWNAAGQQLVTKGNPQGWLASTATALHPQRDTHPIHNRPTNQRQPATPPSGHKQHMRLPLDRDLPTSGHQRSHQQLTQHSTTQPRMAITEWATLAYSDGSCIKTSEAAPARVGAGVYIPETNVLITVALDDPESNTINKAELTAIHAALKAGATRIATDSLCSIYQIRRALANPMSLITHRHNDILTAIATLIIDSPVTLHFYKVRAHSGIIGNEGADALAKHAALHPELANTPAYRPTTRKETNTWLNNEADGETPAPLPDCRQSVRAHMHRRHSLGLANQDSIYYQMSQEITKAAAKGSSERVMADTNISTPAQRTALLYRTGGLYNQKLAMRWKRAIDDRCPLYGEADSATHLLSGCSETLPMVQERHNGAGRLIAKAISKGTLGGYISFADTGSWEKGAKEDLDLPNDTLHTTLRALGLKTTATKNTTRPDILMVMPPTKTGTRGKAINREQLNVAQARLVHQASGAEQLQQSVVRLTTALCAADARASAAEASSIAATAVAASASSDAYASAALLEQEQQLNAALLEETELLHQHVAIADAATMAADRLRLFTLLRSDPTITTAGVATAGVATAGVVGVAAAGGAAAGVADAGVAGVADAGVAGVADWDDVAGVADVAYAGVAGVVVAGVADAGVVAAAVADAGLNTLGLAPALNSSRPQPAAASLRSAAAGFGLELFSAGARPRVFKSFSTGGFVVIYYLQRT
ncbi:hypothetical protein QJQ45_005142 [Haematococcus lacustris]|nr:hypothetical protein QJQ45_005142 [Haematococcus lacustris]